MPIHITYLEDPGEEERHAIFVPLLERSPSIATARDLSAWLSPLDGAKLIACPVQSEVEGFFVGYGVSDNHFKRLDLAETRRVLGYAPQDDAFQTFRVA
ncbi:hypothetical protein [Solirhodobacter olei]|uniref:hypothetical protein n=1 Tax=Solirhodobacter olei TaxID=2493082 RepID=UPI000FDA5246|nr:hypothetical protein [Solirhodobacter olei]